MKAIIRILRKIKYILTKTSFSQSGEDAIVRFLFNSFGKKSIEYLDLGTNTPDLGNNTYYFYKNGGKGVCVEADINLINKIKSIRSRDVVINAGVSVSENKFATFYLLSESALNTFNEEEAIQRSKSGKYQIINKIQVPLKKINDIIIENFVKYPDFLSIDIEGLDFEVLSTLNFDVYPIPVICVETCCYSESYKKIKDNRIIDLMLSNGYMIYADTYINTIFVNKNWFNQN
jgi:FkbM family methyltransferase